MVLLLDTNILIDLYGQREGFFEDAERLYGSALFGDNQVWSTFNSYTDVFYILHRSGMDSTTAQTAILDSLDGIHICEIGQDEIVAAAQAGWPDFEDCLISVCADKIKADYIITRDATGFTASKTPAATPSEFLRILREDYGIVYEGFGLDPE
jgi:predicted nucleic acid-binding protein